jgi:hypothetical protein
MPDCARTVVDVPTLGASKASANKIDTLRARKANTVKRRVFIVPLLLLIAKQNGHRQRARARQTTVVSFSHSFVFS